jgi:class 3 adenylate cyclase
VEPVNEREPLTTGGSSELLDGYDHLAGRTVEGAGGRIVKNTGDGVVACFNGAARGVACARTTLNIAARMLGLAGANDVLVTSMVPDASGLRSSRSRSAGDSRSDVARPR